jgi:hypothetical protein
LRGTTTELQVASTPDPSAPLTDYSLQAAQAEIVQLENDLNKASTPARLPRSVLTPPPPEVEFNLLETQETLHAVEAERDALRESQRQGASTESRNQKNQDLAAVHTLITGTLKARADKREKDRGGHSLPPLSH